MLVEFIIDTSNDRWKWRMIRRLIFPYALGALFIGVSLFNNTIVLLAWAAVTFLVSTIWAYYQTRSVLYRLCFNNETNQVTVDVVLFDKLDKRFIIPFEAFHVKIYSVPLYGTRYHRDVLEIYDNQKRLYKQYNICGWSRHDFEAIQEYMSLMISGNRK